MLGQDAAADEVGWQKRDGSVDVRANEMEKTKERGVRSRQGREHEK